MTLNFSAEIIVDAKDETRAIYDSVYIDNEYYPENPVNSEIKFNKKIHIDIGSEHLAHLRANLNSTLRLIQASYDSIKSVNVKSK